MTSSNLVNTQAEQLLQQIEDSTAHVMLQLRLAVNILLNRTEKNPQYQREFALLDLDVPDLDIQDIERYAPHWAYLLPDHLHEARRASLAHVLGRKYKFTPQTAPHIVQIIGLDRTPVQEAYQNLYGEPLTSIYRSLSDSDMAMSLDQLPLQDTVDRLLDNLFKQDLGRGLEYMTLQRGETLFQQGETGDSMFVLLSGRVRVVDVDEDGHETVLGELGRGQTVGEMSMLVDGQRSATVYALRDTSLCKLSRRAFDELSGKHAGVMNQLAVQMVHHLTRSNREKRQPDIRNITILPITDGADVQAFAQRLQNMMQPFGRVEYYSRETLNNLLPAEFKGELDEYADSPQLIGWLAQQEAKFNYVIYETDYKDSAWTRRCLQQADRILLVGQAGQSPELHYIEKTFLTTQPPHLNIAQELILLHPNHDNQPTGTAAWLEPRNIMRHHHIVLSSDDDMARLVRFLRGQALGVVFGGGGLRGAAHAGAIRALYEAGLKADFVGGTSVGALAAAEYAMLWDWQTILKSSKEQFIRKDIVLDVTLPMVAFNEGKKITQAYRNLFGDIHIEDLWLPAFFISSNLSSAKMMIHRRGLIWRYVRASTALPGVYPPVIDDAADGDLLIDGSTFNNLPADVMKDLNSGGPVIAVDVGDMLKKGRRYDYGDSVNGWRVFFSRFLPGKRKRVPSLLKTLMRTTILTSTNQWKNQADDADLLIKPNVEEFDLFDVDHYDELYQIGYQHAKEKIDAWLATNPLETETGQ